MFPFIRELGCTQYTIQYGEQELYFVNYSTMAAQSYQIQAITASFNVFF